MNVPFNLRRTDTIPDPEAASAPTMNLIGTCATNRVTGSKEPENEGQHILDRPVRCLQYRRLQCGARRAAGGSARGLQDRREIHPEISGRRDNDRAIPEQGYGRLEICLLYTSDAADDLLCVDLGG